MIPRLLTLALVFAVGFLAGCASQCDTPPPVTPSAFPVPECETGTCPVPLGKAIVGEDLFAVRVLTRGENGIILPDYISIPEGSIVQIRSGY